MTRSVEIRVIVFQDGDLWVAQGLEHDIGAQAADLDTLYQRFVATLRAEVQMSIESGDEPLAGIAAAPRRFHQMWDQRSREFRPSRPPAIADISFDMALCA
jgi:hypothetical protein